MDAKRSSAKAVRRVRIRRSCAGVTVCHQRWWRAPFGSGIPLVERYTQSSTPRKPNGVLLGAWELGGDALGLLQNRVEVLCLDEFVGLQVLEGPGAAHRQAGRGRRPGIGEVNDDE